MNGQAADVVYFAQVPGKARIEQSLKTDIRPLRILIQGLAWIDSGDNQIVRLRTELLEPHDDPDLKMQTTDLRFNAVHFKDVPEAFWLPEQVTVTMKRRGAVFRNRHVYSGFQLLRTEMASVGAAQGDLPRETLLARFKHQIQQVLSQVPNYTCLETIQRSVQKRRANAFSPLDTVLLEVSIVADKELMAWPSERRFEEGDLSSFASGGMIGSGVFASLAHNVFLLDTTAIQYYGDEEVSGRMLARFNFRVPEVWSGYQIQANGSSAKVGTSGSFWIDPASLELVRMEVRADDIPAALGIERTATVIDYAPMRIGNSDILLPQAAKILLRCSPARSAGMTSSSRTAMNTLRSRRSASTCRTPPQRCRRSNGRRSTCPRALRYPSSWRPPSIPPQRMSEISCAAMSRAAYAAKAKRLSPKAPSLPVVSGASSGCVRQGLSSN